MAACQHIPARCVDPVCAERNRCLYADAPPPAELFVRFGDSGQNIRMWARGPFPGAARYARLDRDPVKAFVEGRPWTVGSLGRYLLALSDEEQARPVWGVYFVEIGGERQPRVRPLSLSWERIDGTLIASSRDPADPKCMAIWSAQDERAQLDARAALRGLAAVLAPLLPSEAAAPQASREWRDARDTWLAALAVLQVDEDQVRAGNVNAGRTGDAR